MIAVLKLLPTDVMKIRAYVTDWLASFVKGVPLAWHEKTLRQYDFLFNLAFFTNKKIK